MKRIEKKQFSRIIKQQTQMKNIVSSTPSIDIEKQIACIIKEGMLTKQSRMLKSWRERWTVLTKNTLMTFKEQKVYKKPTQVILLKDVAGTKTLDSAENNIFVVETGQGSFIFKATDQADKQGWIGSLNSAVIKCNHKLG